MTPEEYRRWQEEEERFARENPEWAAQEQYEWEMMRAQAEEYQRHRRFRILLRRLAQSCRN